MILAISHLAIGSENIEQDASWLESLGYQKAFTEINLENLSIKKNLLRKYTSHHTILLSKKAGSVDLELIQYPSSKKPSGLSWIEPLFSGQQEASTCNAMAIRARDLEAAISWWTLFGFKLSIKEISQATLTFKSIMQPQQFHLKIQQDNDIHGPIFLDDAIANCLAFITTSVIKEKDLLSQKGVQTTPIQILMVNNRKLSLFFALGPQYEVIEVIGLER